MSTAARNVLWATVAAWGQQGLAVAAMLVLARLLSPADFGLVALAALVPFVIQRILLEAIAHLVVARPGGGEDETFLSTAFWVGMALAACCSAGLLAGADAVAGLFGEPGAGRVIAAFCVLPMIDGLTSVPLGLMRRRHRFRDLATRTLVAGLVGLIAGVGTALAGGGVWALVAQQIASGVVGGAMLWWDAAWRPSRRPTGAALRAIAGHVSAMIGSAVVFVVSQRIDIVVLARRADASEVGLFALAKRIARLLVELVVTGLVTVAMSRLSDLRADPAAFREATLRLLRLTALLTATVFAIAAALAGEAVTAVLGAKWASITPTIEIFCLFGPVQALTVVATNVLTVRERSRDVFVGNLVGLVALLPLLLAVPGTAVGVATALTVQAALVAAVRGHQVRAMGGPGFGEQLTALAAAGTIALAAGVAARSAAMAVAGFGPWAGIGAGGGAGLVVAAVAARLVMPDEAGMLTARVRGLLARRSADRDGTDA